MATSTTAATKIDVNFSSILTTSGTQDAGSALSTLAATDPFVLIRTVANFTFGNGTSQIKDQMYDVYQPGSSTAFTYTNSSAGNIKNINGVAITFTKLKIIYIFNSGTGDITMSGTGWPNTAPSIVPSGGGILLVHPAGYTIASAQTIILTPAVGTNTSFEIALVGSY
jgi:hypothetical protein